MSLTMSLARRITGSPARRIKPKSENELSEQRYFEIGAGRLDGLNSCRGGCGRGEGLWCNIFILGGMVTHFLGVKKKTVF